MLIANKFVIDGGKWLNTLTLAFIEYVFATILCSVTIVWFC